MIAAIELLASVVNAIKEKAPDEPTLKDFEQAIRILEEAEKIEKKNALVLLELAWSWFISETSYDCETKFLPVKLTILNLLESLPDKEPE
jgi:hypothetical protein